MPQSKTVSPDKLKRRPIHMKEQAAAKLIQNETCEDEYSENDSSPETKNLYPDLSGDLNEAEHVPKSAFRRSPESNLKNSTNTKGNTQDPYKNRKIDANVKHNTNNLICKYHVIKWLLLIVVIGLVAFFFILKMYKPLTDEPTIDVSQLINNMKREFQNQPLLTFRILKAALKPVANQSIEPETPAVISLLADKGAFDTALSFSKYLVESLAPEKDVVWIDTEVYERIDSNEIKLKLDEEIKSKFNPSSLNVIVVDKFEKLPVDAAMIFHSYCDHDTAHYKRAVYLFVFSLNRVIPKNADSKSIDEAAISHLKTVWEAHPDKIDSLITRLTVSVVNIK